MINLNSENKTMDFSNFKRKFLFTKIKLNINSDWQLCPMTNNYNLYYHRDLEFTISQNKEVKLVLLGFLFDAQNVEFGNQEILDQLIEAKSYNDIIYKLKKHAGRWIIFMEYKNDLFVFHDPAGMRQIFYSIRDDQVICASQPHMIADICNDSKVKDKILNNFINSKNFTKQERSWIGDGTPFYNIKHLLPNKLLIVNQAKVVRYWPSAQINEVNLNDGVEKGIKYLTGYLKSANYRYDLLIPVTAGWDSRIILAASKEISENVKYFVNRFANLSESHKDIRISSQIMQRVNLPFEIVNCKKDISAEFINLFKSNINFYQSENKIQEHYSFYNNFSKELLIGGNVSEITRNYYGISNGVSAKKLAELFGRPHNKYAIEQCEIWLSEISQEIMDLNVNIYDLFYWEQRLGNWGAMFPTELEISLEEFFPFNSRELLELFLGVNKKYRRKNNHLFKVIINELWPELLEFPFNPNDNFRETIIHITKKIKLYSLIKKYYYLLSEK